MKGTATAPSKGTLYERDGKNPDAVGGEFRHPHSLGWPTLGWFCLYVPEELIYAAGLHPYRIMGGYDQPQWVDSYLPASFCPYIRHCFDSALRRRYDFLDGIVFTNCCMGMQRLYNLWQAKMPGPVHFFLNVPRRLTSTSERFFAGEIDKLRQAMEARFRISIPDSKVEEAIGLYKESRTLLRDLSALQRKASGQFSASEIIRVVQESAFIPRPEYNRELRKLLQQARSTSEVRRKGPRLLMIGSIPGTPGLEGWLEGLGGVVVYDDRCSGNRYFEKGALRQGNPLEVLSHLYLHQLGCARMHDMAKRHERLMEIVKETSADGVIFDVMKYCDPSLYEAAILKTRFRAAGIPMLIIEGEYTGEYTEQLRTRIQAFLEMF